MQPELLLRAYCSGFFPMSDPDSGEVFWLRPEVRAIFDLPRFKPSHSLRRRKHSGKFKLTTDANFKGVMRECANRPKTWITEEFVEAYGTLFEMGHAHSVEVWRNEELVGGLYGVSIGGAFFAESKFHKVTDASKLALWCLIETLRSSHYTLLEVQFLTPHLARLGAREIDETNYNRKLQGALKKKCSFKLAPGWRPLKALEL